MISVVVPAYNEALSLGELYKRLAKVFDQMHSKFEIIFVNDGSKDNSISVIQKLYEKDRTHVRGINMRRNFGKGTALKAGIELAEGDYIVTIDADLQDDPKEIPRLIKKLDQGFDIVSGWKNDRQDGFIKNNTSKIFNSVISSLSQAKLHDNNCGLKVYRAEAAKAIDLYGSMHRYVVPLAEAQGYRATELQS